MKLTELVLGTLTGVVVGGAVVALTTPKTGVELRSELNKKGTDVYYQARDKFSEFKVEFDHKVYEIEFKLGQLKDASLDKYDDLKEEIQDLLYDLEDVLHRFKGESQAKLNIKKEELSRKFDRKKDELNHKFSELV